MHEPAPFALPKEPRLPRYQWGQRVQALADLCNDGSYPDAAQDELLVPRGVVGEVVRIGHHTESGIPVYLVDFGARVLGCLEDEIAPEHAAAETAGQT